MRCFSKRSPNYRNRGRRIARRGSTVRCAVTSHGSSIIVARHRSTGSIFTTSGRDMGMSRVGFWLCVAPCVWFAAATPVAAAGSATAADDWGLPQLMREMAQVKSASAHFTEWKTMHMLSAPLQTSGTLGYVAPDRIQKITVTPVSERFVLDGDKIVVDGGPDGQVRTFSL